MLEISKLNKKSSAQTVGELLQQFREAVEGATGERPSKEAPKKGDQPTPAEKKDFSKDAEKKP
jgi:hypothetical protein